MSDPQVLGYELAGSKISKEEAKHSSCGQALARRAGDIQASWCKTGVSLQDFMEGCRTKTGLHPFYNFWLILLLLALTFKLDRNGLEAKKEREKFTFEPSVLAKNNQITAATMFPMAPSFSESLEFWGFNAEPGWNQEIVRVGGVVGASSLMGTRRPSTRIERRLTPLFTLPEASIRFCWCPSTAHPYWLLFILQPSWKLWQWARVGPLITCSSDCVLWSWRR